MYLTSKFGIIKLITIVIGVVSIVLGYGSILTSSVHQEWTPSIATQCDATRACPAAWKTLERIFLIASVVLIAFSAGSLLLSTLRHTPFKPQRVYWDSVFFFIGGVVLLLSGELVLDTAIKLDRFFVSTLHGTDPDLDLKHLRNQMNYVGKVTTGALGILNGVMYIVAAGIIASKWKPPRGLLDPEHLDVISTTSSVSSQ